MEGPGDTTSSNSVEPCAVEDADPQLPDVPEPLVETDACGRPDGRLRRIIRRVLPLLIGAGALLVVVSSTSSVASAAHAVARMDPRWLAVALSLEAASLLWLALHLRVLAGPGTNAARVAPIRMALVVFGLGSVLPAAPAEGLVMATAALKRRRVDRRRIAVMLGFSQWFSMRGLFAVAAINVMIALTVSDVPTHYRGGLALAAVATVLLLALTTWLSMRQRCAEWAALVFGRIRHLRHCPPAAERRAHGAAWHAVAMHVAGRRRDRWVLLATTAAAWACDGLCLHFALVATGSRVSVDVLLMAYTAGALASNVPLLPAGLGVVETVTPLILSHYGVPLPTAIAAVLVYRVFGTLLPAAAGALAVIGLKLEGEPEIDDAAVDEAPVSRPGAVAVPVPVPALTMALGGAVGLSSSPESPSTSLESPSAQSRRLSPVRVIDSH